MTIEDKIWILGQKLHDPKNTPLLSGYLTAACNGIYESRRSVVEDAKHSTQVIAAILGATCVAASIGIERYIGNAVTVACVLWTISALVLLVFGLRMCPTEREKLTASYALYIAAVVHAACVHKAAGLPLTHPWMESADPLSPLRYDDGAATEQFEFNPKTKRFKRRPKELREIEISWCHFGKPTILDLYSKLIQTVRMIALIGAALLLFMVACAAFGALIQSDAMSPMEARASASTTR